MANSDVAILFVVAVYLWVTFATGQYPLQDFCVADPTIGGMTTYLLYLSHFTRTLLFGLYGKFEALYLTMIHPFSMAIQIDKSTSLAIYLRDHFPKILFTCFHAYYWLNLSTYTIINVRSKN